MATMLDCKQTQAQISEYIDGTLPTDLSWKIQLHLSSCAVCTEIADQLRKTTQLLAALPTPALSDDFDANLARRLADIALKPRPTTLLDRLKQFFDRPRVRPVFASSVAFAALVPVAVVLLRPHQVARVGHPADITAREESAFDDLMEEHASATSTEAFGDHAAILLASSPETANP